VSHVSSPTNNAAVLGTLYIIGAQVIFAVVNFVYDVLTNPWNPLLADDKMTSSSAVFWQYLIATVFALPLIFRIGFDKLKTRHPYCAPWSPPSARRSSSSASPRASPSGRWWAS
jgi:hypothetical protein